MKEIGGYFGLEQLVSNEYYKDLITLNNGRNALLYVLKSREIKKLYMPYYLCNSVSDMCSRNGYEFEFYNIDSGFLPIFDRELAENEYLYVVNYYGQLTQEKILSLKNQFGHIILDNVQAFFQKPLKGIDTIYSCRKFFGVPDGAYLSSNSLLNEELEIDISQKRMSHLLGRFEGRASDYYRNFKNNDATFKHEPLKRMSHLTKNILGAINYEKVRSIRENNYLYLNCKLNKINKLRVIVPEGAFAYPLYLKNGLKIKKILAEKKIYIPTLWPNVLDITPKGSIENDYVSNILPLPCDQRYTFADAEYMISEILKAMEAF